jgi:radical SAM superfamily enzyme YgiQ (UPF0313 family)
LASTYRKQGIPVILGGIHVTMNPDEAMPRADAVVIGEAELTWPRLIQDFRRSSLQKIYRADTLADFKSTPLPRRELLKHKKYRIPWVVQASKGCQYECEFCALPPYAGSKPRYRNVEDVIDEIAQLPGKTILFADDNIYSSREFAAELFNQLIPLRKRWVAESTWHIAFDEEVLSLAAKSGCIGLFIGLDSVNRQHKMRKIPRVNDIEGHHIRAVHRVREKGIVVMAGFVFGLDNDDTTVFSRSLRVILESGADVAHFNALTPYPGTPIFNRLSKEGRIIKWDWSKYHTPNVCFEPKNMSVEQLKAGTLWAQNKFFSRRNILRTSFSTVRKLGWAKGLITLGLNFSLKEGARKEAARAGQ